MSDGGYEGVREIGRAGGELMVLPFRLIGWLFRLRRQWRAVPLDIKSFIRVRTATFALIVLIGGTLFQVIPYDNPIEIWGVLVVAGLALLNLAAGLIGVLFAERWQLRFDPMSIWWWSAGAVSCAWLVVYSGIAGW